jgi:hypothetical protein
MLDSLVFGALMSPIYPVTHHVLWLEPTLQALLFGKSLFF